MSVGLTDELPKLCPFCGEHDVASDVCRWDATSLDEDEQPLRHELSENQCRACGLSFWTGCVP